MWPTGRKSSPSPPPFTTTDSEPRKRSSSDAVATPKPAAAVPSIRFLSSTSSQDSGKTSPLPSSSTTDSLSSRRLGFFTHQQKYRGTDTSHQASSSGSFSSGNNLAPIVVAPMSGIAKPHVSPSKASYGRTFDSKVSREMHRLGNLAHLPAGLAPSISQTTSSSTLALPQAGTAPTNMASTTSSDPWGTLHVHLLPLFNGEPLKIPIEDLNVLVRRHIQAVVSASVPKALTTLENDASELIASGMVTLNAKLAGLDDDKLVGRVVEIWGFFWDQVLTYVEGVLLPLQTDPLLSALHRTPKRPTSPGRSNQKGSLSSLSSLQVSPYHIDVRTVALRSFRDRVLLPLSPKLYNRLSMFNRQETFQDSSYQQPRLQQMLLVLTSQGRSRGSAFSYTSPAQQPSQGETAVADLLRVVGTPRSSDARTLTTTLNRTPSFLSGGLPRDRRGRIAQKAQGRGLSNLVGLGHDDDISGDEALRRHTGGISELERERERVVLESLRSPGPDTSARASGGWGLGAGYVETAKTAEEEEEEELNWDQAQALVERMVGMKAPGLRAKSPEPTRKRIN